MLATSLACVGSLSGCGENVDPGTLTKQETQAPPDVKALPDAKDMGGVFGKDPIGGKVQAPGKK